MFFSSNKHKNREEFIDQGRIVDLSSPPRRKKYNFWRFFRNPIFYNALAFALLALFLSPLLNSSAEITIFNPSECIGSWGSPELATGKTGFFENGIEDADEKNSASYTNTEGEIICRKFVVDQSQDNLELKRAKLKLSLALTLPSQTEEVVEQPESQALNPQVQGIFFPDEQNETIILDPDPTSIEKAQSSPSLEEVLKEAVPENGPIEEVFNADEEIIDAQSQAEEEGSIESSESNLEEESETEPISLFDRLIRIALAQEGQGEAIFFSDESEEPIILEEAGEIEGGPPKPSSGLNIDQFENNETVFIPDPEPKTTIDQAEDESDGIFFPDYQSESVEAEEATQGSDSLPAQEEIQSFEEELIEPIIQDQDPEFIVEPNLEQEQELIEGEEEEDEGDKIVFEIYYSLKPGKWEFLNVVTRENANDLTFDIPLKNASDLANLKIKLEPVGHQEPIIENAYLNSIALEVEFQEKIEIEVPAESHFALPKSFDKKFLEDDALLIETEESTTHSCSVEPFSQVAKPGEVSDFAVVVEGNTDTEIAIRVAEKSDQIYSSVGQLDIQDGMTLFPISFSVADDASSGSYSINVFTQIKDRGKYYTSQCQLNLVIED